MRINFEIFLKNCLTNRNGTHRHDVTVKVQNSCEISGNPGQSILQRVGIRQLPGICWYPVRAQEIVKQGGTAGNVNNPSLTEADSVMGGFFVTFSEPMAR
mgnify:CR=1 FL=1